jgi:hypothetical protein
VSINIGEEICGEWLRWKRGCEFIQYDLQPPGVQGDIDVLGLNTSEGKVYVCEVAIHLVTGLQYVRNNRPDNVKRLTHKLELGIRYVRQAFPEHQPQAMLWSPVVRDQRPGSKYNQVRDVQQIQANVVASTGVVVEAVINERYQEALLDLREVARKETKALASGVMRYLQVEEHLKKHLE